MTIVCFGTTFRQAPVAFREQLVLSAADVVAGVLNGDAGPSPIEELVPLSTCNRTELYAVVGELGKEREEGEGGLDRAFDHLTDWLVEAKQIERHDIESRFYRHRGIDAVRHLCRVAAGLDSLVIGESEIAGQVSGSLDAATDAGGVAEMLPRAFRTAIRAGRRARAETGINRKPASVSSVAVGLANEATGGLAGKQVVLVGTGKMGRLACEALRTQGVEELTVIGRTFENAEGLAAAFGGDVKRFAELGPAIASADVVITSTGAAEVIIDETMVRTAMASRSGRALTIIDIAVPRDVDSSITDVEGVLLFDIDALQDRISDHVAARQDEIPLVEAIIDEEIASFAEWQLRLGVQPLIVDLRNRAEHIRREEIARTLRRLGDVDQTTRDHIEHLSRSLVNKLLHEPTQQLRANPQSYESPQVAHLTRQLFGLDEDRDLDERRTADRRRAAAT